MSAVAVVGLGAMGSRIAHRLIDAGHEVWVWNRTLAKAEPLVALGASACDTPAEAASAAEAVLTMVSDPQALRDVTEGAAGVIAGLHPSTVVIEMSTVGPAAIARLKSVMPEGASLMDCPVLGSIGEAENGTLKVFVGGTADLFARWRPLLSAVGSPIHVGSLGSGAAAKLVANLTLFGVLGILGEALALADGLGLARAAAFEVLAVTPIAGQSERRKAAVETGEYPKRFALSLARKDAELVADAAAAAGVDLRLALAARDRIVEAEENGWGERDYSAVLAHILRSGGDTDAS
ncbi:MAG TPA: NAD(P)-dependent oxidoreductase [Actinomycetota bacterium]|nr:NAD(P)-dependent oxidoreductase [Actinomycetota bacterium]